MPEKGKGNLDGSDFDAFVDAVFEPLLERHVGANTNSATEEQHEVEEIVDCRVNSGAKQYRAKLERSGLDTVAGTTHVCQKRIHWAAVN